MAIHTQFQPLNPFRSPAWRAEYIDKLLSHQPHRQRPSRLKDDEWVKEGWKFLREWYRYGIEPQDQEDKINNLFPENPGLFFACLYYGNEDSEWRIILEACLLARMSDDRIAERLGTHTDAVYWYEKIFFDVRNRLDNSYYICKVIHGRANQRAANREGSITAFQREMLLKTVAYYGGEHVLNLVLTGFTTNMAPPRRAVDAKPWVDEAFNTGLSRHGLVTTTLLDVNKFNVMQAMQLVQDAVQQEHQMRMTGGPGQEIERNIEKASQLLSIQMAGSQEELVPGVKGKRSRRRVSELRSAEQLQMAAGKQPSTSCDQDEVELRARMKQQNAKPDREVQQRG